MKLYTEEQLDRAMDLAKKNVSKNRIIESLTPIELPSDEEIDDELQLCRSDYQNGCNYGAKWMRDKIQGGNK